MRKSVLVLLAATAALGGCNTLRETLNITRKTPDEFAVTTKAPLVIPPGFNLMPPSPGAAPTNTLQTDTQAQVAMFGAGDTASVAANIQGNYSAAERMLLATAGVSRVDPGIRQQLQSDQGRMQGADSSFTSRLLGTAARPNDGQPINADAELERRRNAPRPAASRTAPATRKSSGGWFDWF